MNRLMAVRFLAVLAGHFPTYLASIILNKKMHCTCTIMDILTELTLKKAEKKNKNFCHSSTLKIFEDVSKDTQGSCLRSTVRS